MNELKECRERIGSLDKQCKELISKATDEKRAMTSEEETSYDALWKSLQTEKRTYDRLVEANELRHELSKPVDPDQPNGPSVEERKNDASKALRTFLTKGAGAMTDEQRSILIEKEGGNPTLKIESRTAQTVTTTGGGYLVQTDLDTILTKALKAYGGVRKAAKIFTTTEGNPMDRATIDDTSNKGRLLDINTQVTNTGFTFGKVTFYAYKFSSDIILLPTELLQDEKVDINAYIGELLGERVGRIESDYMTTGTGSSQPQGCQYAATDAVLGLTSASAITKANLIDLVYSVDPAYRESESCGFMFNDATAKVLYKLSLGTATDLPLFFKGGLAESSNALGMSNTLFGYPYWINQSMPDIGAGTYPVIFGDFSRFMIRDVAGYRLLRLTERYADYDQIGVILLHRSDSRLMTTGAIKKLKMGNT